ncbi:MAG TPA: glycosyl hydrolase [Thermoanaerobaculia bacterium]|nr:glycosyl hydrolase [Thermoanaerobaculia bacterium]
MKQRVIALAALLGLLFGTGLVPFAFAQEPSAQQEDPTKKEELKKKEIAKDQQKKEEREAAAKREQEATAGVKKDEKAKPKKAEAKGAKKADEKKDPWNGDAFSGLELRGIGPALTSGRITDFAVDPNDRSTLYLAAAAAGIWKSTNRGVTWKPIFDEEAVNSIGCIAIDPQDSLTIWAGSGENNSQRSVSWGDGVYKSTDGGASWKNMGLAKSEHIGKILIDPRDSNVVWVAAQGPLWAPGGDRGLYKTTDGGKTWKKVLDISENTGVSDLAFDPRNPDVVYAVAYQRRRHVWTLIDGGPESGIHKTRDGGATWTKLSNGLPKEDMGRIGIAVAPTAPDTVYATIEAARKTGGFFRSKDGGASWERTIKTVASSPQYYQELFVDPKDADRIYAIDTFLQVSEDGGTTFANLGEENKHVDNHVVWIDPEDTRHLFVGCDGGLYESFDRGKVWRHTPNLSITQFYRVAVDNSEPFYYVYGGTQDNFSLGGPSRTNNIHGGVSGDWFVTQGGDGFFSQVDPVNPNIVYAESQDGGLVRHDRKSGEQVDIQPQPGKGEPPLKFNWDAPILISPHSPTRLYFAANRLFRSDDRGDTWRPVSPDLTRQVDRNLLPVMGKVWGIDAVAKNASTSFFGNIVSLAESPVAEGVLYVGTDDGLVQATEDGGEHWRKIEKFPGVPDNAYVSRLEADVADPNVVYVAFDNHKMGDFNPYVLKSGDRGRTWVSIAGDLPKTSPAYALKQDPGSPDLMFAGTEFGLFFTKDGGKRWLPLKGGLPTVAVRDIAVQKREGDLVIASFGRGFFILDDLTPLREATPATIEKDAELFGLRPAKMYIEASPGGEPGPGFRGSSFFTAPNPPFGAVFTYYLKEGLTTKEKQRWKREKEADKEKSEKAEKDAKAKKGEAARDDAHPYPSWNDLRAEAREPTPEIVLTVTDDQNQVVRRLIGDATAGFHRVAWNLRYPAESPIELEDSDDDGLDGPLAPAGTYKAQLAKRVDGILTPLGEARTFRVEPLGLGSLPAADQRQVLAFHAKVARLQRAVMGAGSLIDETKARIDHLKKAVEVTAGADPALYAELESIEGRLEDLEIDLSGDSTISRRNEPVPPGISDRINQILFGAWGSTSAPTATHQENYRIAAEQAGPVLDKLRTLVEVDLPKIERQLDAAGAPWTPGRMPVWKPE